MDECDSRQLIASLYYNLGMAHLKVRFGLASLLKRGMSYESLIFTSAGTA